MMLEVQSWEKMETEQLSSKIGRKMVSGNNFTIAQVLLARDAVVPRHSHVNEQFTYILSGALKFTFDDQESVVVHGGEVLFIPSNVPHSAVALEDTLDLDIFAPRREDWINKTDSYLRGK
jgi:quercetin dioxygenase-like cupin family protein